MREYGARGSLTRFVWPVRPLRVLLYNGVNHYDTTRAIVVGVRAFNLSIYLSIYLSSMSEWGNW